MNCPPITFYAPAQLLQDAPRFPFNWALGLEWFLVEGVKIK